MTVDDWEELRDQALQPQLLTDVGGSEVDRAETIEGFRLLGRNSRGRRPTSSQLLVHDVIAIGARSNFVMKPRRGAKTTGLYGIALGRGASTDREDYRVGILTATTGKAGRSRFMKDVAPAVTRNHDGRLKVWRQSGQERIEWADTGNFVQWCSTVEDIRSEAFDLIIVDEAGEAAPHEVDEILGAALPTLDTRPDPQLVIAGTAGDYRKGNLLWDYFALAEKGLAAGIGYHARQDLTVEDIETWNHALPIILETHPGVRAGLTPIEAVKENFHGFTRGRFLREYFNVFGDAGGDIRLFDAERLAKTARDEDWPEPPKHFGLAIEVAPDQSSAWILAAWRENGRPRILQLEHRPGVAWLAGRASEISLKYRVPIVHDSVGPVRVEAEAIARQRPAPKTEPQKWADVQTAAALLVKEYELGHLDHWAQPDLVASLTAVVRRIDVRTKAWAYGRLEVTDDIGGANAAAFALRWYDEHPQRPRLGIIA